MAKIQDVVQLKEFKKDLKRLTKRYRTLSEDLKVMIRSQIYLFHEQGIDNDGIKEISDIKGVSTHIYKVRKFACRSLKGKGVRSGIRVTYTWIEPQGRIELIEIYYKGDKENEDWKRIQQYYQ